MLGIEHGVFCVLSLCFATELGMWEAAAAALLQNLRCLVFGPTKSVLALKAGSGSRQVTVFHATCHPPEQHVLNWRCSGLNLGLPACLASSLLLSCEWRKLP